MRPTLLRAPLSEAGCEGGSSIRKEARTAARATCVGLRVRRLSLVRRSTEADRQTGRWRGCPLESGAVGEDAKCSKEG